MAELLKDKLFSHGFIYEIARAVHSVYSPFKAEAFAETVLGGGWEDLELKARGRRITLTLGEYLPADYEEALGILEQAVTDMPAAYFFPDFVEIFGQDEAHWEISVNALEQYTSVWSSEMAVRPFIIKDEERMMARMYAWSMHENEHIRRLASEGCRPQLPWSQALNSFKKDPSPILPILEQLKTDPSEYVRKSVANNINDISKTHPDLVVQLAKDWYGKNERTDWIVKHGCRTLLKKGNRDALALFGYLEETPVDVEDFVLETAVVALGEMLTFSFVVSSKEVTKVRLEFGIDYVKSRGARSRKIFQISEVNLKGNKKKAYSVKHSFKDLSTRKHYPGTHSVALIVNGTVRGVLDFEVVC
jgi:3-methyladenine DNA glycosylase AlkC